MSTATARLNILDCDGYGMMNFFENRCRLGQYQNRDCLYVRTLTGEKIVLVSGGGKAGDERLVKGNTYGTAYITEANECHPNFLHEVFDRTISSPNRKIFHDLNPKSQRHWYYEDILKFHEDQQAADPDYGYNYGHFTIADNMSISGEQLRQILKTYDKNSVWYKRDILGNRCIADGLVYPMFNEDCIFEELPWQARQRGRWWCSVDYGTVNPCSIGLWCTYQGVAYRVKEYYYDSRAPGHIQRTDEEHYAGLERLAEGHKIERVIVDPSASSFKAYIRRRGKFPVWNADNDVINGIRATGNFLKAGKIKVHSGCTDCIAEFGLYSWDTESAEDRVIKEHDHCLTGDTLIDTLCGPVRIEELVGRTGHVYCADDGRQEIGVFRDVRMTRKEAEIFEVTLANGRSVKATAEHPILTRRGWVQVKDLRTDDEIACIGGE